MPKQIPAAAAEAIICAVRKNECLYDTRSPGYRNRHITELAWKSVSDEVQKDASYCKFIWASLRATFNRNLANVKKKPSRSASPHKQPKWAFYQHMLFLREHMFHGQLQVSEKPPAPQSHLESGCDGGAEEESLQQALVESQSHSEEDEYDVTMRVSPLPPSSDASLAVTVSATASAPSTPAMSTPPSSSPVSGTLIIGKKRTMDDASKEQDIQHCIDCEEKPKPSTLTFANDEQGLAVFGHLLPFYQQLPPLKQIQFLHHISGYLMELYAESHLQ